MIKMGGVTHTIEKKLEGFVADIAFGLLTGVGNVAHTQDHSHMSLFLLNVRTGEMLWTGEFAGGGQPNEAVFRERLEKILNRLPNVIQDRGSDRNS